MCILGWKENFFVDFCIKKIVFRVFVFGKPPNNSKILQFVPFCSKYEEVVGFFELKLASFNEKDIQLVSKSGKCQSLKKEITLVTKLSFRPNILDNN